MAIRLSLLGLEDVAEIYLEERDEIATGILVNIKGGCGIFRVISGSRAGECVYCNPNEIIRLVG